VDGDDLDASIERRYGFALPALYQRLRAAGCFDPHHPQHLQFADLIWLEAAEIRDWQFDKRQIAGLVPLAQTERGDLWCWYPAMAHDGEVPVVFCPDEDEVAVVLAPHFQGFVYRALLEEFACTALTERRRQIFLIPLLVVR